MIPAGEIHRGLLRPSLTSYPFKVLTIFGVGIFGKNAEI